jgi:hypothetical protein
MFPGLMSRWMMPSACVACSASEASMADVDEVMDFELTGGQALAERLPFHQLHHDERVALVLADVVDGADVGVVQCRRGAGLGAEAVDRLVGHGRVFGDELDGHLTAEPGILPSIHDPHAASSELREDLVVGDGASDHRN